MSINILRSILGLAAFLIMAYLFSTRRKQVNFKQVGIGLLLQFILAWAVLKMPYVDQAFYYVAQFFVKIYQFSLEGSAFLFGDLVRAESFGFIFAFRVLPAVIFFSALSSLLFHLRILPFIVAGFSKWMQKLMGLSGAESLSVAANIFLGHTEAPLLVKAYIPKMTSSELHTLITGGFASITGAVLAALVGILGQGDAEKEAFFATHFLMASVISAPAAIVFSKIILPETADLSQKKEAQYIKKSDGNAFDAITSGSLEGLKLAANIGAILLVFVSLISMINYFLAEFIGESLGINQWIPQEEGLSLGYIFRYLGAPFAWLIGIPTADLMEAGQLIGEKTFFNEIYAYSSLSDLLAAGSLESERSALLIAYGICGFANFGSIGIMIGAINTLAPSRRAEAIRLSILALLSGSLACFSTACIAGIFI